MQKYIIDTIRRLWPSLEIRLLLVNMLVRSTYALAKTEKVVKNAGTLVESVSVYFHILMRSNHTIASINVLPFNRIGARSPECLVLLKQKLRR